MEVHTDNVPAVVASISITPQEAMPSTESSFSSANGRALVRRIDLRLIPMLFIIYVAAFLDR
jgi:hypothetical protein